MFHLQPAQKLSLAVASISPESPFWRFVFPIPQNAYKVTSLPQDSGIFLDQAGRPLQLGRLQSQSGFKTLLKSVRSGKAKNIITAVKAALKPFDPNKVKIELLDTLYDSSALVSGNPAP